MSRSTETAFLPAALEIQQTPPSPAGRAILWTILAFFTLAIVWASLSEVDIVAVAQGRIIPSGHSKTVQPLEIGTVTAIHVTEGKRVEAGEVLIELDPTSMKADVERVTKERDTAAREIARFQQLSDWMHREHPPTEQELQEANDNLVLRQWREFEDRIAVLGHEEEKQRAEQRSAQRQVDKLEALLPIVTRRANNQKGLAEQKLLPEQQYLETERERLEIYHDLRTQQGRVAELDVAIEELGARTALTRSEFHRQVLERLDEAEGRHAAAKQELIKAESRARAQTIKAPVAGTVQQLAVHNIGAIVTPAQELMVIVPQGGALEVEAILENKDIGFVEVGHLPAIAVLDGVRRGVKIALLRVPAPGS